MKRARDEEEEIERVDTTLESLTEEMRQEVFANVRVTLEERDADWHLESVAQVSTLFYDSLHGVARVLFRQLAQTVLDELTEWNGYTTDRPPSLVERFPYSVPGKMGLSFPWCMRQFYDNPPLARNRLPLGMQEEPVWNSIMGPSVATYQSPEDEALMRHYIRWIFHTLPPSGSEEEEEEEEIPSYLVPTYLYICYARFPQRLVALLGRITYKGAAYAEAGSKDPVVRFRRRLQYSLTYFWLQRCVTAPGKTQDAYLLFEWLACFHTNTQLIGTNAIIALSHALLHVMYLRQVPRDLVDAFVDPVDVYFFVAFFGPRPAFPIHLVLDEGSNRVLLTFTHPQLLHHVHFAMTTFTHYKAWIPPPDSLLSPEQYWIQRAYQLIFGSIQHYAEFVRVLRPDTPLWTYLATKLPAVGPQSPQLVQIIAELRAALLH
jgi:hypothetical protein